MTLEAIKLFEKLKNYFWTLLILIYFDSTRYLMLEPNAFGMALRAIFLQLIKKISQ